MGSRTGGATALAAVLLAVACAAAVDAREASPAPSAGPLSFAEGADGAGLLSLRDGGAAFDARVPAVAGARVGIDELARLANADAAPRGGVLESAQIRDPDVRTFAIELVDERGVVARLDLTAPEPRAVVPPIAPGGSLAVRLVVEIAEGARAGVVAAGHAVRVTTG